MTNDMNAKDFLDSPHGRVILTYIEEGRRQEREAMKAEGIPIEILIERVKRLEEAYRRIILSVETHRIVDAKIRSDLVFGKLGEDKCELHNEREN